MAYKFQRGAATLSGSIKAEDGLDANSAGFAGAGAIAGASSIDGTGDLTMGTITMTGFTVDADGDTALKSLKIDDGSTIGSDTKGDAITIASNGDTDIADGCDFNIEGHNGTDTGLKLADTLVTSTAAELNKLDGAGVAVTAAKLTTLSALSDAEIGFLDGATTSGVASKAVIMDANKDIGGVRNLSITGDLTVQGTTTTIDSTTINVSSSFTFEGPADDFETTLGIIDPTADRTINLPNQSGTIPLLAAVSTTQINSTPEELNLVDGSSAGTIVNSKAVIYGSSGEVNATTLQIAGSSITATAAELNVLDGLAAGRILVGDGTGAAAIVDASTNAQILVGNGSTLASVGISGDIALTNAGLTTIQAGAVEHSMLADDIISGQAELNNSGDLAAADDMMIHDNDAGEVKRVGLDTLRTFFQTGVTADTAGGFSYSTFDVTSSAIANAAGSPGFFVASGSNAASPLSASVSTTLHLSGGNTLGDNEWANGMIVYLKAPSNASSFNLTIVASGSERIDGEQQIVLESDNAAVTLLRCHNSRWSIV